MRGVDVVGLGFGFCYGEFGRGPLIVDLRCQQRVPHNLLFTTSNTKEGPTAAVAAQQTINFTYLSRPFSWACGGAGEGVLQGPIATLRC